MGLFGGKSEDDLRTSGTPTSARVTYVDDTGKRRDDGAFARVKVRLQIDSGSARGRELEKAKWVPATRIPRMGEHVQIRFDPDDVDDWAWGDAAMYAPAAPAAPAAPRVAAPGQPQAFDPLAGVGGMEGLQQMIATAFAQGNVSIERSNQVIDLTGNAELREQMLGTLRAYGVDIDAMQAATNSVGASQPPQGASQPPQGASQPPESADETAVKLRQLDELHRQGILSDEEHRTQRQRIIDAI